MVLHHGCVYCKLTNCLYWQNVPRFTAGWHHFESLITGRHISVLTNRHLFQALERVFSLKERLLFERKTIAHESAIC